MKIVCDACQAKYSISDDKVQGKVFKIRCKKCSNIIVVRGGAGAAEPAPAPQQEKETRVYDYGYEGGDRAPGGDEAVWHVVIDQGQEGPMTAVDVRKRYAGGEIDSETYVWREGFENWVPLAQVDTFAALVAAPAQSASARAAGSEAVASMFGGGEEVGAGRSDPGDLFAAASASARQDDDGGDLFGSKPVAQPAQGSAKLRGERNENSVLFSLNNLAQLASDKPLAAAAPLAPTSSVGTATSASGGEGSGLIDIRSMASAYLGATPGGVAKPASASVGSIDDLPVFGGGGFSEPAVIVPISARTNNNKLLYALIGSVGLLAVAAVIVVVVLLKSGDSKPGTNLVASTDPATTPTPRAPEPTPPSPSPASTPEPSTPSASDPATASDSATTTKPPEPGAATPPDTRPKDKVAAVDDSRRVVTPPRPAPPRTRAPVERTPPPAPKETPVAKDTAAKDGGTCDEVSCVLNNYEGACCAKFKRGGARPAAGGSTGGRGDVPEGLDKPMISDGLGKVKDRVMSCSGKSSAKGSVKISVKVGADGHVTNVTVKNTPDANLGNCVASMMQKATFAKTQAGGSFSYAYTF
jgi:predicted Zn finger-like uncharacterized protein